MRWGRETKSGSSSFTAEREAILASSLVDEMRFVKNG